jgi:hypothetical protein
LKVATRADQLAVLLSVKVALYDPVEVANIDSFAAGDVPVSCSTNVYPLPAVCVPV